MVTNKEKRYPSCNEPVASVTVGSSSLLQGNKDSNNFLETRK